MTTIAWPTSRIFEPAEFEWGLEDNILTTTSPLTKQVQTLEIPGARWTCMFTFAPTSQEIHAAREAFLLSLRSGGNRLSLWHHARPVPQGTMRGTPKVKTQVAQNASTMTLKDAGAGSTVLAGDLLDLDGQLIMVSTDAAANGSGEITIPFFPRARSTVAVDTVIGWDKPKALFIPTSRSPSRYRPREGSGMQIQFVEVFS